MKKQTIAWRTLRLAAVCLFMITIFSLVACTPAGNGEETVRGTDTAAPAPGTEASAESTSDKADPAEGTTAEDITEAPTEPETSEVIDVPVTVDERYFIYRIWNFSVTPMDTFKMTVDTAAESGFNAIKVHIPWATVQPTADTPDFTAFDQLIDYVVNEKGLKVAISLDLTRRAEDALVGVEHIQQDPAGNLCVGGSGAGDRTVISFCSDYAVDLAVRFYGEAVAHYHERYGDAVLFYLPAFNPYCETEYWAVGDYDYSPVAKAAFADFLKAEYGTVDAMNTALGAAYADFSAVEPPATSKSDGLGLLWYRFRHDKLKAVIDALATKQKALAPDSDYAIQLGAVFDNAVARRTTVAFTDLCEHVDVLWVDDGPTYPHDFSMDYIRSALPGRVKLASEIDGPHQVNASPENYREQGLSCYLHGATYVSIANWSIDEKFDAYRPVWREIADTWLTNKAPAILTYVEGTPMMEVSLMDVLKRGGADSAISQYRRLAADGRFVYIRVTDDLTEYKVTKPTESYSFPGDFSDTQGAGNWYYRSYRRGQFTDMTYQSDGYWLGEAAFTRVMEGSVHPDDYDAAIVFQAPRAGTLDFFCQLTVISDQSDGIKYTVLVNGEPADGFDKNMAVVAATDTATADLTLKVSAGDEIALIVNCNRTNSNDTTSVSLSAEYTD